MQADILLGCLKQIGHIRLVIDGPGSTPTLDADLINLLKEARTTQLGFRAAPEMTIAEHAKITGQCRKRVTRLVRLSWLSPSISQAILEGRQPPRLTARKLLALDVPPCWDDQARLVGLDQPHHQSHVRSGKCRAETDGQSGALLHVWGRL
jgi:hypothetical protein